MLSGRRRIRTGPRIIIYGMQMSSDVSFWGFLIALVILASTGALMAIIEGVCGAREAALSELEKAAVLNQIMSESGENEKFLYKIYMAGSVSYCDADKLQMLLGADKLKSIERLRDFPCCIYACLTGG